MSCFPRHWLPLARFHAACHLSVLALIAATTGLAFAQDEATSGDAKPAATPQEAPKIDPLDWPGWRGPQQNSVSPEKGLVDKWSPKDPWQRNDLGTRSTPIVMRGKLYLLARDKPGSENEGEKVVCVDAATGEQLWQYRFNVYLTDTPDTRVAWSSVVGDPETGRVYAQGVSGYFCCLEGNGKLVWDRSLHEEVGVITTYGGRTNVPIIFEDTVLISAVVVGWGDSPEYDVLAKPSHRFMALDKATGELRWLAGTTISPPDTTYSTPVAAVINGEAQLVFGGADGQVWSLQPRTGKQLWNYPFSRHGINSSPLVSGDTVYMAHGLENMVGTTKGGVVAIDAKQRGNLAGKEKWLTYAIVGTRSSPLMVDGKLWLVDEYGNLHILDPATGKEVYKKDLGSRMDSTPLYADGKVYLCTYSGIWYILKPTADGVRVVQKLRLPNEENSGSPVVSHGKIYLPMANALYSMSVKGVKPSANPLPEPPQETSLGDDPNPALVQVSPFDVTLKPGDKQQFTVRLYNSRGQLVRVAKPEETEFRVTGPGEVKGEGEYTAPEHEGHVGALVYCKVGNLEGKARVRIIPPLPWQFDFNKGELPPITWIGGRVRYEPREVDGEKVIAKRDVLPTPTNPNNKLGTRSPMYMGPASLSNYTIQGDFRLTQKNNRLPEVTGLINSGYILSIRPQAKGKELSLYSWASHDYRTQAGAPLDARPDAWYRMKLTVQQVKGTAQVKGKIWLRDQPEPQEWTVQMVDQSPVKSGSPGIYGNTQMAEFLVDNLSVSPNG